MIKLKLNNTPVIGASMQTLLKKKKAAAPQPLSATEALRFVSGGGSYGPPARATNPHSGGSLKR